jgi:hypothetical protein
MGTTSSGLRYPEPTDPVNQGAAAIKNLADDVTTQYPKPVRGIANTTSNASGNLSVIHNAGRLVTAVLITETNVASMAGKYIRPNGTYTDPNSFAATLVTAAGVGVASSACQFNWLVL